MKFRSLSLLCALLCALLAASTAAAAKLSVTIVTAAGRGVDNAVVTAVPTSGKLPPFRGATAIMDQRNLQFSPFVLAIRTGTRVSFPNSDNVRHQVFSFSPAKVFELPLYSGTTAKPVVFDKAGLATLGCSIHDAMIAYVYVTDSPWFGTSKNGTAVVDDIPAGDYEITVWHPLAKNAPPARKLKIGTGGAELRLTLEVPAKATAAAPAAPALQDKFRKFGNGKQQ
jgi:plastocyanin